MNTKTPHCWHKAKDPHCEGFPVPTPTFAFRYVTLFGPVAEDEDALTHDSAKTTVERKMTYVCCRCNATAQGWKSVKVLWWTTRVNLDKPGTIPPCKEGIRAVDAIMHKEAQ